MSNPDESRSKDALRQELNRLEESAMYSAQGQFEQAKLWRGINLLVGIPAALLAAVSGATGLADAANRVIAAYLALGSAGLGALVTLLNGNRRTQQAHGAANAYLEVQTAARQLREIDLPVLPFDEARTQLAELTARRDEINKTADIPSRFAYRRAGRNISGGGQTYAIDEQGGRSGD
ncbi:SLATT domain-containing protein [Nocardia sp. 852002-20019_SCH5090214]|uniref:SLATT domain-containing protein n=1 Tax=Nocardia sp. 852002-20019_SCH5090214 TaxID=1834087 RepID=UPI0009EE6BAC|nr:SLATT domain-containing protein [Nocardia sp. 852002-20019_SCH5090214]